MSSSYFPKISSVLALSVVFWTSQSCAKRSFNSSSGTKSSVSGGAWDVQNLKFTTHVEWAQGIDWSGNRNPFFQTKANESEIPALWGVALQALSDSQDDFLKDDPQKQEFKNEANSKSGAGQKGALPAGFLTKFNALSDTQKDLVSAEFLVAAASSEQDLHLRRLAIEALGFGKESDKYSIEILAPLTRGVYLSPSHGTVAAWLVPRTNEQIIKIAAHTGTYITQRFAKSHSRASDAEDAVRKIMDSKTKVLDLKPVGKNAGVNATLIVKFQFNSSSVPEERKFVFKSMNGTKVMQDKYYDQNPSDFVNFVSATREARAANFFSFFLDKYTENNKVLPDAQDYAPMVMPITLEVAFVNAGVSYGMGTFQEFLPGYKDIPDVEESPAWSTLGGTKRWLHGAAVLRLLDFNFGNGDRLRYDGIRDDRDRNLMLKLSSDEKSIESFGIIDNSVGLPGKPNFQPDRLMAKSDLPEPLLQSYLRLEKDQTELLDLLHNESAFIPRAGLEYFYWQVGNIVTKYSK